MTEYLLFFLVILVTNVIHGITGFAGTVLAMPFGLMLVGYPVAKPILNVLAIIAGIYVYVGCRQAVNWKEVKKIVAVMAVGLAAGILIKGFFADKEFLMYQLLGWFVMFLAVQGLWKMSVQERRKKAETPDRPSPAIYGLLGLAGLVHGIFVAGGPLLIGYLTKQIPDKRSFRATISTVWIFLNTIILFDDIRAGYWTPELVRTFLISVPFLFAGMMAGSRLYAVMSQKLFMVITYVLLFVSGISLLVK